MLIVIERIFDKPVRNATHSIAMTAIAKMLAFGVIKLIAANVVNLALALPAAHVGVSNA